MVSKAFVSKNQTFKLLSVFLTFFKLFSADFYIMQVYALVLPGTHGCLDTFKTWKKM